MMSKAKMSSRRSHPPPVKSFMISRTSVYTGSTTPVARVSLESQSPMTSSTASPKIKEQKKPRSRGRPRIGQRTPKRPRSVPASIEHSTPSTSATSPRRTSPKKSPDSPATPRITRAMSPKSDVSATSRKSPLQPVSVLEESEEEMNESPPKLEKEINDAPECSGSSRKRPLSAAEKSTNQSAQKKTARDLKKPPLKPPQPRRRPTNKANISIFSEEFLRHDEEREKELRKLRRDLAQTRKQSDSLRRHLQEVKTGLRKSVLRQEVSERYASDVRAYVVDVKKRLLQVVSRHPVGGINPTLDNLEEYLAAVAAGVKGPERSHDPAAAEVKALVASMTFQKLTQNGKKNVEKKVSPKKRSP